MKCLLSISKKYVFTMVSIFHYRLSCEQYDLDYLTD